MKKHYLVKLNGNDGGMYEVQCMKVDHIVEAEPIPDVSAAYKLFPYLPMGVSGPAKPTNRIVAGTKCCGVAALR